MSGDDGFDLEQASHVHGQYLESAFHGTAGIRSNIAFGEDPVEFLEEDFLRVYFLLESPS
jgi:hypothetical protein